MSAVAHCKNRWLAATAACLFLAAGVARAASVSATLEPKEISLGDSAQLTITTFGNSVPAANLAPVAGLQIQAVGQSRRIQSVNGVVTSMTSIIYRVTPQVAGIFTIPGVTSDSEPVVLRVDSGAGPGNAAGRGSSAPRGTPGAASESPAAPKALTERGIRLTPDGSAFVRFVVPKREIYVGESVPVDIQVGMRDGFVASLNGLPTLNGDAFTLNNLSHQPERAEEVIDGKPFTLLTWRSVLAAVKPGEFSLTVETPLTVRIRTRPQRESTLDDLLGDPFLQNFFGATVSRDITVASPPAAVTVTALPTEGRPADFSGAVGNFKITGDLSAATTTAGDPLTLRMHVVGTGNFDRVDSKMLSGVADWKTYPPKATFTPADALGYRGEKVFEQPVIAERQGAQTLPGLAFSFFNPVTRRYETARSAALAVTVSAMPGVPSGPLQAGTAARSAGNVPAATPADGLRPDHAITGRIASSLVPPYLRPRLLTIPSALALLFAGGWLALKRRARGSAAARKPRPQSSDAALQDMAAASAAGDTPRFFAAARSALRHGLATRWQLDPEHVTDEELIEYLGAEGEHVRRIFALADEAKYSGRELRAVDLQRWLQVVRHQLSDEKPS